MTIEDIKSSLGVEIDNFPVGMRVLAVDDDSTCLMLLDGLLRKCQYQGLDFFSFFRSILSLLIYWVFKDSCLFFLIWSCHSIWFFFGV